jgi:hypothetical protein
VECRICLHTCNFSSHLYIKTVVCFAVLLVIVKKPMTRQFCFIIFGLMVQMALNLEWFFLLKLKVHKTDFSTIGFFGKSVLFRDLMRFP